MSEKGAPHGNQNAVKPVEAKKNGLQVNFYLSAEDASAIKRFLTRQNDREPTTQEIRRFAREQSKNGIWQAIKHDLPAIII